MTKEELYKKIEKSFKENSRAARPKHDIKSTPLADHSHKKQTKSGSPPIA